MKVNREVSQVHRRVYSAWKQSIRPSANDKRAWSVLLGELLHENTELRRKLAAMRTK